MELIFPVATCHCTSHCVMILLFIILANKFSLSLSLSLSSTETRACQLMSVSDWPSSADNFAREQFISEGTEVTGIPKYFSARCTSLGYLAPMSFHHIKGLVLMT